MLRRMMNQQRLASFFSVTLTLSILNVASSVAADNGPSIESEVTLAKKVSFANDVWPILNARCVNCHDADLQEGGFALHTKAALLEGGSRGPALDSNEPEESVLVKMIQLDAHPRMPFEEDPLTQSEITIIENWVANGAIYEQVDETVVQVAKWKRRMDRYAGTLDELAFAPIRSPFGLSKLIPFWPVLCGVPVFVLYRRWRQWKATSDSRKKLRVWPATCVLVAVNAVLIAEYYQDCLTPNSLRGMQHQVHLMFGNPPVPVNMDPEASLSRVYYRGNDERDEAMFNNGHYLTCKFKLSLIDDAGRPIEAGTQLAQDQDVFLRMEIDRAPYTPDVLFDEEILGGIFLTSESELDECENAPDLARLKMTVPQKVWVSELPLQSLDQDGVNQRLVYIWQTIRYKHTESIPKLHYAAKVMVDMEDGIVQPSSTLWFNAMRYTQPFTSFALPAEQWLSVHPIPELPGPNTESPELLGLREHVNKKR